MFKGDGQRLPSASGHADDGAMFAIGQHRDSGFHKRNDRFQEFGSESRKSGRLCLPRGIQ